MAAGSLVALAAVFGSSTAPPINIPVMIIGGGVDMPYVGFELPLLLTVGPPALGTHGSVVPVPLRKEDRRGTGARPLWSPVYDRHGPRLLLPVAVVVGLMLAVRLVPQWIRIPACR